VQRQSTAPQVTTDPVLEALAKQVRSLYCTCMREYTGDGSYGTRVMPQWDGDAEGTSGARTTSVWPRIAHCILQADADPYQFIRAQFYSCKLTRPPSPNTLYNDAAVEKYEGFREQAKKEIQRRVESDDNQVTVHTLPLTRNLGWPYQKALDYVLRDTSVRISPLLRYCHAVAAELSAGEEYQQGALLQYVFQVNDYDAVLQQRIPTDLRVAANSYRSRFVRNA